MEKSINQLRKEGNLSAAWKLAQDKLIIYPEDERITNDLLWVYYSFLKEKVVNENFESINKLLSKILELDIKNSTYFNNSINWMFVKVLRKNISLSHFSKYFIISIDQFLQLLKKQAVSESKSVFIQNLLLFVKTNQKFMRWIAQLSINDFRDDDFKPVVYKGKRIMPLFERWVYLYAKYNIICVESKKCQKNGDEIIEVLDYCLEHFNYKFITYYKAKYLIAINEKEQAKPVAKLSLLSHLNQSWAWELFALSQTDNQLKAVMLSKAILQSRKKEYSLHARSLLFKLMDQKEEKSFALLIAQTIIGIRSKNKWSIPDNLKEYIFENHSYTESENLLINRLNEMATDAISYVLSDCEFKLAVVTGFDKKSNKTYFLSENGLVFKFKIDTKKRGKQIYRIYYNSGEIIYAEPYETPGNINTNYIKTIENKIKRMSNFGFIGGAFIPPKLYQKIGDIDHAKVLCIKGENPKTRKMAWKVISVCKS